MKKKGKASSRELVGENRKFYNHAEKLSDKIDSLQESMEEVGIEMKIIETAEDIAKSVIEKIKMNSKVISKM